MDIVHSSLSRLGTDGTAGFFIIAGCLSAVTAFMAITGLRERKAPALCMVLAVLYGAVMVTAPAFLLVPFVLGGSLQGMHVVAFLAYMAMLVVKIAARFPASPWPAARIVLIPWAFALVHVLVHGQPAAGIAGYLALQYLAAGLISFTAFWFSFPFIFFGQGAGAGVSAKPARAMQWVMAVIIILFAGITLTYRAWLAYLPGEVLSPAMIVPALGVAVSVVMEIIDNRKLYRAGMM